MWSTELPPGDTAELQRRLAVEYRIEVPVLEWEGRRLLRVSVAPYNDTADSSACSPRWRACSTPERTDAERYEVTEAA